MNWYKKASNNFYILGKRDSDYITTDNPNLAQIAEAIRLKNGEIIYGEGNGYMLSHWELYLIAKKYIGSTKDMESLGYISPDGVYTVKISNLNNLHDYMFGEG